MSDDESLEYIISTGTLHTLSDKPGKGKRIEGFVRSAKKKVGKVVGRANTRNVTRRPKMKK